jgi:hypothetical protein
MALPINTATIYNLILPSTGKSLRYRQFFVKEEKALLIAQQSEDMIVMVDTLKAVIKACILDDLDTDKLATFDLEYLFCQIRAKSVGENVELLFGCDDCPDDPKAKSRVVIDLTTLEVTKVPTHTNKITLFADVGVIMKYPTMDMMKLVDDVDNSDFDQVVSIIVDSIESIYTGSEVFHAKEQTKEELVNFVENLTPDQFKNIQTFFETMPRLKKEIDYTCPVCNKAHHKVLEGINSFF